jgi:iduronate 2-sulfatase
MCFLKKSVEQPSQLPEAVASGLKPPIPPPQPPKAARNVLFVPMDDQRPLFRNAYGQSIVISPSADRLAKEGTVFTRAFANFAWCAPSRNSFMSGRRPDRTRAWDFEHHFREVGANWTSLPQAFKNHGFFTTGVGKLFHPGLPPDFDPPSWTEPTTYPITFGYRNWSHADAGGPQPPSLFDDCDSKLAELAIERLTIAADRFHNHSQPFFVGFGLRSAHIPYHYPPAYGTLYPPAANFSTAAHTTLGDSQPVVGWYDQSNAGGVQGVATYGDVIKAGGLALHKPMAVEEAQRVRRNYYATTSYSDAQLGKVLDSLVR